MALADDREPALGEAVDQPQLPDRLGAIEALREDPRREGAQLLLGAGLGQGRVPHVIAQVELRVVDPDWAPLSVGDEAKLLAKSRDQVQARLDVVAELDVLGRGTLEHERRGDVHVRVRLLENEEGVVESGQAVVGKAGHGVPSRGLEGPT